MNSTKTWNSNTRLYYHDEHESLTVMFIFIFVLSISGGIILGLSAKSGRLQHWAEMVKHPNQTHTRAHYLSANYID